MCPPHGLWRKMSGYTPLISHTLLAGEVVLARGQHTASIQSNELRAFVQSSVVPAACGTSEFVLVNTETGSVLSMNDDTIESTVFDTTEPLGCSVSYAFPPPTTSLVAAYTAIKPDSA